MHVVQTQGETRYVFRHPLVGDEIQNRFELLVRRVGVEDPLQSHWRFRRKLKFESERPLAGSLDDRVRDMSAGGSVKRAVQPDASLRHQNVVAETPQDPGLKVDHHGVVLPGCDPDARQWPQWIVRDGTTLLG